MTFRTPRGLRKVSYPVAQIFENSQTPSYPITAAAFLPVWAIDRTRDDPVALPPGTWVGTLNERDHSAIDATFTKKGWMAPASQASYTITYGANDLEDAIDEGSGTPDIDEDIDTIVAAAGASSTSVAAVKPLGILGKPVYAGWLKTERWENYDPDLWQGWISKDIIIRIPAITTNERAIEAGDIIMVEDTSSSSWDPATNTNTPGRSKAWDAGNLSDVEYVVGRCVRKIRIGRQATPSAGGTLDSAIGTGAPRTHGLDTTAEYLWPEEMGYKVQSKISAQPGFKLSATDETLGRPAELLYARADANGDFWALDIKVEV